MEELIYHYKAFISHTECDSHWAKRLHDRLNHYSIPSKLRKLHPGLPKNLRPVFWYKRDISELHLKQVIRKELYNSEYLIVICSPESAKSVWVNEEVRIFKEDFGRGDRIIPFVVDGTANATDPGTECFPDLLRNLPIDEQIRGIDVRGEDGTEGAYINVIATMLKVRYDELYQRYEREKKKRIFGWCAAVLISLVISFFMFDYFFNTKYEYYLDYADCNGIPVGIMPIDEYQAKKEYRAYRFEYLQDILRRVVHVDNKGNAQPIILTEYKDHFPIQELLYENGKYVGIECKDHVGDILCRYNFSKDFKAVNISDDQNDLATSIIRSASSITNDEELKAKSHFLDNILLSPSKIGRYEYDRDSSGYISAIYYCENPYESNRTTDVNGIAGIKYTRDSLHRVTSLQYIDLQGKPKSDGYGVVCRNYTYDPQGHLAVSEYYNGNGELQYNELGWAKAIVEYDMNGYPVKQSQYGKDGKHCTAILGESIVKYEWGDSSMKISYYDENEVPILISGSASTPGGYHSMIQRFDQNGDIVRIECYDMDSMLCYNNFHWAISKIIYYNRRPEEHSFWSPEDEPCYNYTNIHRIRSEYQNELIISESYWGPDNVKTMGPAGFHTIFLEYRHKKVTDIKTYNTADVLCPSYALSNAAHVEIEYNNGYPSAVKFMDANGKLCLDPNRDINNPYIPYRDWAICRIKNVNGMNVEYSYYDNYDRKMLYKGAFFRKELEYNDVGKIVKASFYDEYDNLTRDETGSCITETQYDADNPNLPSSFTFKKDKDNICNNNMGVARVYMTYYPNGKIKSESYFNEENAPAHPYGVHSYTYEYDDRNRLILVTAMKEGGLPAVQAQNKCHKMEYVYGNDNWIIETKRFDTSSKLTSRPLPAIVRYEYGKDHQITRIEHLDNNYKPCNNPDAGNVATCLMDYDQLGRKIHEKYLNENNETVVNTNVGYAEILMKYKHNSRVTYAMDENGELINVQGVCRIIEINSETSLPLCARRDLVNNDNELEIAQRFICEYDEDGKLKYNYYQDGIGNIVIYSTNATRTVNIFDEDYDALVAKLNSIEESLIEKYLDNEILNK